MDSIYDSLQNYDLGEQVQKLQEENEKLSWLVKSLEEDIEKLCNKILEMKKVQDNLSTNISELFKTAKAEIDRRDRTIAELRSELEALKYNAPKSAINHPETKQMNLNVENKQKDLSNCHIDLNRIPKRQANQKLKESLDSGDIAMKSHSTAVLEDVDPYKPDNRRYQNYKKDRETREQSPRSKRDYERRSKSPLDHPRKKFKKDFRERSPNRRAKSDDKRGSKNNCERTRNYMDSDRERGSREDDRSKDKGNHDKERHGRRSPDRRNYDDRRLNEEYRNKCDRKYNRDQRYSEWDDYRTKSDKKTDRDRDIRREDRQHIDSKRYSTDSTDSLHKRRENRGKDHQQSRADSCTEKRSSEEKEGNKYSENSKNTSQKDTNKFNSNCLLPSCGVVIGELLRKEKSRILIMDPKQSPSQDISINDNHDRGSAPPASKIPAIDKINSSREEGEISDDSILTSRNLVEDRKSNVKPMINRKPISNQYRKERENLDTLFEHNSEESERLNKEESAIPRHQTVTRSRKSSKELSADDAVNTHSLRKSARLKENSQKLKGNKSENQNEIAKNEIKPPLQKESKKTAQTTKEVVPKPGGKFTVTDKKTKLSENKVNEKEMEVSKDTQVPPNIELPQEKVNNISVSLDDLNQNMSSTDINARLLNLSESSLLSTAENYHLAQLAKHAEIPTIQDDVLAKALSPPTDSDVNQTALPSNSNLMMFNQDSSCAEKPSEILCVPSVSATAYIENLSLHGDINSVHLSIPEGNKATEQIGNIHVKDTVEINVPEKCINMPRLSSIFSPLKPANSNEHSLVNSSAVVSDLSKSLDNSRSDLENSSLNATQSPRDPTATNQRGRKRKRCIIRFED